MRVALCGRPVAVVRDGDWLASWQHASCKDRGCPACAQARSRRLARQIRLAVDKRRALGAPALAFVTLTQPRHTGESLAGALARLNGAWQKLRKLPEFHAATGGVRVLEVTHAPAGWHVHAHCIVELAGIGQRVECPTCEGRARVARCIGGRWVTRACRSCSSSTQPGDGSMHVDLATLISTWATLVEARGVDGAITTAGQCAVPLDDANAGQLAKYLSKLWELDDASAVELFETFRGKRLVQTWGCWYRCVRLGPQKPEGRQWYRGHFVADIERMHPRSYIEFHGSVALKFEPFSHAWVDSTRALASLVDDVQPRGAKTWRPSFPVRRMTAGAFLRALRADDRRADEHPLAPLDLPTPGADALRVARSRDGPWAHRRRTGRWLLEARQALDARCPLPS